MRNRKCRNGLTLIELLVVIAIIATLAAMLLAEFVVGEGTGPPDLKTKTNIK